MMKLTKQYEDGSFGTADCLPCGENSHAFKKLIVDRLGAFEALPKVTDEVIEVFSNVGFKAYMEDILEPQDAIQFWLAEDVLEQLKAIQEEIE